MIPTATLGRRAAALAAFFLALLSTVAAAAGGAAPAAGDAASAARVLLVRHAEAEPGGGGDPELTAAGRRRAEALAEVLAAEPIAAVLATDTRRARATAAPIAVRLGLEVEIYDPRRLPDLAAALRGRGETVLVVGHSNTTPELVGLLGGEPGEPIGHHEHDRLYRVDPATGATTLERLPADPP
jgi:broad specificity phosphatase PhoE